MALTFILYDAAVGGQNLGEVALTDVQVSGGRFSVDLDFGPNVFDGSGQWLEIDVDNTTLNPRQRALSLFCAARRSRQGFS